MNLSSQEQYFVRIITDNYNKGALRSETELTPELTPIEDMKRMLQDKRIIESLRRIHE